MKVPLVPAPKSLGPPAPQTPPGEPPVCAHACALVEDHEIVKFWSAGAVTGLMEIVAVGGGAGSTVSVIGRDVTPGFRSAGLQDIDSW